MVLGTHILANEFDQVAQRHDSATNDEVKLTALHLGTLLYASDIAQPNRFSNLARYFDFLANAINQCELTFRKQNSQRDTGLSLIAAPVLYPILRGIEKIGGNTWKE